FTSAPGNVVLQIDCRHMLPHRHRPDRGALPDEDPGRVAHHDRVRVDVARDDGARSDERTVADPDSAGDHGSRTEGRPPLDCRGKQLPVVLGLQRAVRGGTRVLVVDEEDTVAHEDLVLDLHPGAYERVALDLAVRPDAYSTLDLDERSDPGVVADLAPVEIRERVDDDVLTERHVLDQPVRRVIGRAVAHLSSRPMIASDGAWCASPAAYQGHGPAGTL